MNEFEIVALMALMYTQGIILGYILWAPETSFKRGFVDGLSLKFLWKKK
jgi:hypothetical protein